jgi:hypothetical protein
VVPLRLTSRSRRAAAATPCRGPKGRGASIPAVPPSLREGAYTRLRVSLGCCVRGSHPPDPTWTPARDGAPRRPILCLPERVLSSAGRSGARSGARRRFRASTVPGSLGRLCPVLLSLNAGLGDDCVAPWSCVIDCVRRRPLAHCHLAERRSPSRRAGEALRSDAERHRVTSAPA